MELGDPTYGSGGGTVKHHLLRPSRPFLRGTTTQQLRPLKYNRARLGPYPPFAALPFLARGRPLGPSPPPSPEELGSNRMQQPQCHSRAPHWRARDEPNTAKKIGPSGNYLSITTVSRIARILTQKNWSLRNLNKSQRDHFFFETGIRIIPN